MRYSLVIHGVVMKRFFVFVLFLLVCLPAAYASLSLALDVKQLSQDSELIVRGTVKKTKSMWSGKRIVTEVTLTVNSSLKGTPGSEVTLYTPGGVVDGVGMKVSGAPSFREKEEVFVFLKSQKGNYSVLGLGQGKYTIGLDTSGKKIATPDLNGLELRKKLPDGTLVEAEAPKALLVSDLEAEVKKNL
jgi:hypothetical protein